MGETLGFSARAAIPQENSYSCLFTFSYMYARMHKHTCTHKHISTSTHIYVYLTVYQFSSWRPDQAFGSRHSCLHAWSILLCLTCGSEVQLPLGGTAPLVISFLHGGLWTPLVVPAWGLLPPTVISSLVSGVLLIKGSGSSGCLVIGRQIVALACALSAHLWPSSRRVLCYLESECCWCLVQIL